jgi:hypothetical protein
MISVTDIRELLLMELNAVCGFKVAKLMILEGKWR